MNNQSSRRNPNTSGLIASAASLFFTWLEQVARLYLPVRLDVSRFPSSRIFPIAMSVPILAATFFSSLQQGVGLGLNAAFTGALALMTVSAIRMQPNVRLSSALMSALFLGGLIGSVLQWFHIHLLIVDLFLVWMVLVSLRISLAAIRARSSMW